MAAIQPDTPAEVRDIPGRSMLLLYGSETGNSQDIAEEIGRAAQRLHFKIKVDEMNAASLVSSLILPYLSQLSSRYPRRGC